MRKYSNQIAVTVATIIFLLSFIGCCTDLREARHNFSVGDILFTDGTFIKAEDVKYGVPDNKMSKAIAVIAAVTEDGRTLGIGIKKTSGTRWAKSESFGETSYFENLITKFTKQSNEDYIFSGDLDGSDNWNYICSIDPEGCTDAKINYPAFYYANIYGETANLSGTEFEKGWYLPTVNEMYDIAYTNRDIIQESLSAVGGFHFDTGYYLTSSQHPTNPQGIWSIGIDRAAIGIFAKYCPSASSVYLRNFNEKSFVNYKFSSSPNITSVEVATAAEGYTGEIPVTIIGNNLKGHKITSNNSTFGNVKYLSDSKVIATIVCKGIIGEEILTVSSGSSGAKCSVNVVASQNCFSVGDILFTDGTRVKVEDIQNNISDKDVAKVFGVVASAPYGGGTAKVIGLQKSAENGIAWTIRDTVGYKENLVEIRSDYNGLTTTGFTFVGDLDGSDNWEYICSVDSTGTSDAKVNYPMFYFAKSYGKTACLVGSKYENGWYVPSVKELYDVYCNKDIVQKSLNAVGGFSLVPAGTERFYEYWSSSSSSSAGHNVSYVNFVDGDVGSRQKSYTNNVLVMLSIKAQ